MDKFYKSWRRFCDSHSVKRFCFDGGSIRILLIISVLLLLIYSLAFHHFIIIFTVLLLVIALIGTFFG